MAGNQLYVCAFCVYRLYVFGGKINAWKKKHFTQTVLFSYPVCPLSLQPGQLITSSHHWLFLHNNKNAINIYGNAVWKQEATPSLMPAECTRLCTSLRLCVRACLSVCFFLHLCPLCAPRSCVQRELLALMFSMQGTADTPISLHGADASYASASPPKNRFISMLSGAR